MGIDAEIPAAGRVLVGAMSTNLGTAAALACTLALSALACSRSGTTTSTAATAAAPTTTLHRETARQILEVHCGLCHLPPEIGGGTGMALHVYDLTQLDWSATLSDPQLPILEQKLRDDGADGAEMSAMHTFVVDEIDWRDAHPDTYTQPFRARPPRGP